MLGARLIDGVIDGGATARAGLVNFVAQQTAIAGEGLNNLRLVVEGHGESLVFAAPQNAVQKIDSSFLLKLDAVADTVGSV